MPKTFLRITNGGEKWQGGVAPSWWGKGKTMRMRSWAGKSERRKGERERREVRDWGPFPDSSSPSSDLSRENSPFGGKIIAGQQLPQKREVTREVVFSARGKNLSGRKATPLPQAVVSSSGLTPASRSTLAIQMMTGRRLGRHQDFPSYKKGPL
ncbi:hypothetical protein GWK47_031363 [Chionoecetes opilio]|uniref:Uncharacterized protein n=1 Tax=Chionoecetes opilio TaxID=41210 RepID=A0A8J5D257_CHIOP|nr:hypothetical protein GWK47_031363 [Chionoecetes opilio]